MSFGTYRQYDSRWGKKNYNGSSTYAAAACGPTSCANILHAINPKITPLTTGAYMQSHGYAIRNQGTSWNGIPACLRHFGASDVRQVDSMADVFKYCSKGYVGVFLFVGGTKGGVTWTTSGHFVAVTGYKYKNKKHYFKTFDSGGRRHDGWYCYETQMKGLIRRIWLCKIPTPFKKPTTKYTGSIAKPKLKKGSKGDEVKKLQKFLEWYYPKAKFKNYGTFGDKTKAVLIKFQQYEGLTQDGVYGDKSYKRALTYKSTVTAKKTTTSTKTSTATKKTANQPSAEAKKAVAWAKKIAKNGGYTYKHFDVHNKHTKTCPICHKEKGKYKGWNCIGFVSAAFYHGAGLKSIKCACNGIGVDSFFTKVTLNSWTKRNGKGWKMISNGGSKGGADIPASKLLAGDALICYDKHGKFHHIALYIGNSKYIDCTNTSKDHIAERPYSRLTKRYHVTRAFRYVG